MGGHFTLDISGLESEKKYAYWNDPVSGVYSFLGDVTDQTVFEAVPPKKPGGQSDWTLVIRNC